MSSQRHVSTLTSVFSISKKGHWRLRWLSLRLVSSGNGWNTTQLKVDIILNLFFAYKSLGCWGNQNGGGYIRFLCQKLYWGSKGSHLPACGNYIPGFKSICKTIHFFFLSFCSSVLTCLCRSTTWSWIMLTTSRWIKCVKQTKCADDIIISLLKNLTNNEHTCWELNPFKLNKSGGSNGHMYCGHPTAGNESSHLITCRSIGAFQDTFFNYKTK